jgi:hypothetical protein
MQLGVAQQPEAVVRRAASVSRIAASADVLPPTVEAMYAWSCLVRLLAVPDGMAILELASITPWANGPGDSTLKLRETFGAGLKVLLPPCAAVIVHAPVPFTVGCPLPPLPQDVGS